MSTATKGASYEPYQTRQPLAACTLLKDSGNVLFIEGDSLKLMDDSGLVTSFAQDVALPRHSCELSCDNCGNVFVFGSGGMQKVTQALADCSDTASRSFSADTGASIVDDWGDTITPAYDPQADELILATRTALYRHRGSSSDLDSPDPELWAGTEGWSGSRDSDAGPAARFTCITGVVAIPPSFQLPSNLVGEQPTAAPASASRPAGKVHSDCTHTACASTTWASRGSDPVEASSMPTTSLNNGGGGSSNITVLPTPTHGDVARGSADPSSGGGGNSPGSWRSGVLVLDYRPYDGVTLVRHVAPCGRVTTLGAGRAGGALRYPCLLPRGTPLCSPGSGGSSGSSKGVGAAGAGKEENVGIKLSGREDALFCATDLSGSGWDGNGSGDSSSSSGDGNAGDGGSNDGRGSFGQALEGFVLVACCTEGDQLLVLEWSGRDLELCGGPGEVLADLEHLGLMDFGGQDEVMMDMEVGSDEEDIMTDVGSNSSLEDGAEVEGAMDSGLEGRQELVEHEWCNAGDKGMCWHEGWFRGKFESEATVKYKYDKRKYIPELLEDDDEAPVVQANLWLELSGEQLLEEAEVEEVAMWICQQYDEDTNQCAYGSG